MLINRFEKMKMYCEEHSYQGWDPYDGLNSKIFQTVFPKSELSRLVWIQIFKKSPINLRPLLKVYKGYNPKALGLFLSGYCNLYKSSADQNCLDKISFFSQKLIKLISPDWCGACWGYNFDWQARAFYQPKGTPNIVVTSFVGCALIDAYEVMHDKKLLAIARSACDFILKDLNRTYDGKGNFLFSYSPIDNTQVFNASLLGARLLSRTYLYTKEPILIEESQKVVSCACEQQQQNGAWAYSPLKFHHWIDNFHSGFNLECIYTYQSISGDYSFQEHLEKGLDYYLNTFFEDTGLPRYYSNSKYPIDMHSTAQLVITLNKMKLLYAHKELVERVLTWSFENMFDEKKGYFYYQKNKYFTSKIPYMRWTQAWMFYAMSEYFLQSNNQQTAV